MSEDLKGCPRFGDIIENGWASEGNPTRVGFFVRAGKRTGRLNAGSYYEVTDGAGKFWELPSCGDHKITVRPQTALGAATAPSTGDSDEIPGLPPDTSWNKRASPPGGEWRWVPVEPTFEMLNAAIDVDSYKLGDISPLGFRISPQKLFERCYAAMLSAAPPREAVGVGIEGSSVARVDMTQEGASDSQRKSEGGEEWR